MGAKVTEAGSRLYWVPARPPIHANAVENRTTRIVQGLCLHLFSFNRFCYNVLPMGNGSRCNFACV